VIAPGLCAPESQDLVRLNHVLEHLRDPVGALAVLREWLPKDGLLYVEVPDIEVYCRAKSRGGMFHYGHIYNFNPWTLRAAAGLAGLVEAEETAGRCAGTTGVFLLRGPVLALEAAVNRQNGAAVEALIRRHQAGEFGKGRERRRLTRILARIEEAVTGFRLATPRAIGEAVARNLDLKRKRMA